MKNYGLKKVPPLLFHGKELSKKVQTLFDKYDNNVHVELCMGYLSPSIKLIKGFNKRA